MQTLEKFANTLQIKKLCSSKLFESLIWHGFKIKTNDTLI